MQNAVLCKIIKQNHMFSWYILALKFLKYIRNLDTIIPEKIVPQMLPEIRSCPTEDPKLQNSQFFFHFTAWQIDASVGNRQFYHLLAPASGEILKCGVTPIFLCLWTALAWHKQCNYKPIHWWNNQTSKWQHLSKPCPLPRTHVQMKIPELWFD